MLEKMEAAIKKYRLLEAGERVVVAVSGGADSVSLAAGLSELAPRYGWQLHVAYLNHQLRPREAALEEEYVGGLARELGWPVTIGRRDVAALARTEKRSLEDAARRARYAFLQEVAGQVGAAKIAVGHQQNDQAETLLLHLLFGAGTRGLRGMLPRRGPVIRPLLEITRQEIIDYLQAKGLTWCTDASNEEAVYRRNKVRLELMPYLAENYNPEVVQVLSRTATILAAEEHLLEGWMQKEIWPRVVVASGPGQIVLDAHRLAGEHPAWQRRVIRRAYAQVAGVGADLDFQHVEAGRGMLAAGKHGQLQLPGGIRAVRQGSRLVLGGIQELLVPLAFCRHLAVPGRTPLPRTQGYIDAAFRSPPASWSGTTPAEAYLDAQACGTALYIRYWQPGDYFYPLGLEGKKKLQDFFTDAKIPQAERHQIPLVTTRDAVVWVAGWRIDARFQITPATPTCLYLRLVADAA